MITFKEYLRETEELGDQDPDKDHDSWEEAAVEYMTHCSDFVNINTPLYRISGESWFEPVTHYLKTRSPRIRSSESRGGSAEEQKYLFSQPEWQGYPNRRHSVFCSTTKDFDVGSIDKDEHHERNLLMIFPFNGVKIAMLDDRDLNTMNILKNTSWSDEHTTLAGLWYLIRDCFAKFDEFDSDRDANVKNLLAMKKLFLKGENEFDSSANGNEAASKNYFELEPAQRRMLKMLVTEFPQKATPKDLGVKLITNAQLDLPGKTRECWFSGKYMSVPARDYPEFREEVIKLQKRKLRQQ